MSGSKARGCHFWLSFVVSRLLGTDAFLSKSGPAGPQAFLPRPYLLSEVQTFQEYHDLCFFLEGLGCLVTDNL